MNETIINLSCIDEQGNPTGEPLPVTVQEDGTSIRLIFGDPETGPDIWIAREPQSLRIALHPGQDDPTCYLERFNDDGRVEFFTDRRVSVTVDESGEEL